MGKFLIRTLWIVGITLALLGGLSFYVRFQTLKYDLRPETGDILEIRR